MNFDLSEEQELLQQTVRQFVENEAPPTRVRELFDAEEELDRPLWNGLVEVGIGGLHLPEEHGGAGLELLIKRNISLRFDAAQALVPVRGSNQFVNDNSRADPKA